MEYKGVSKMEEIWKDIEGYEGLYQASDMGRVKRLGRKVWNGKVFYDSKDKILKLQGENGKGCVSVWLSHLGKPKREYVAELVAKLFVLNENNYTKINHIDKDKTNNAAYNLGWSDNIGFMPNEIWKDIKNYEGLYRVSNMGRVRSLGKGIWNGTVYYMSKEKFLISNVQRTKSENIRVRLTKNKKTKNIRIDMIVLNAFCVLPDTPITVENIDGNMFNNKLKNLSWCCKIEGLLGEVWKNIDGYSSYMISNMGRVKSLSRVIVDKNGNKQSLVERLMAQRKYIGYYKLTLRDDISKIKTFSVHRIVAITFIPNLKGKPIVNHIDGNKLNNCAKNLEWMDAKENAIHAVNTIPQKHFRPVIGINLKTKKEVRFNRISKAVEFLKENGYPKTAGTSIGKCCKSEKYSKSAYGYKWEYQKK